jgi:hypothetical protein
LNTPSKFIKNDLSLEKVKILPPLAMKAEKMRINKKDTKKLPLVAPEFFRQATFRKEKPVEITPDTYFFQKHELPKKTSRRDKNSLKSKKKHSPSIEEIQRANSTPFFLKLRIPK